MSPWVVKSVICFECLPLFTGPKIKFSIKDFFSKSDQIRSFLRICSHLLKKSLMENFIFCAVFINSESASTLSNLIWRDFVEGNMPVKAKIAYFAALSSKKIIWSFAYRNVHGPPTPGNRSHSILKRYRSLWAFLVLLKLKASSLSNVDLFQFLLDLLC